MLRVWACWITLLYTRVLLLLRRCGVIVLGSFDEQDEAFIL